MRFSDVVSMFLLGLFGFLSFLSEVKFSPLPDYMGMINYWIVIYEEKKGMKN